MECLAQRSAACDLKGTLLQARLCLRSACLVVMVSSRSLMQMRLLWSLSLGEHNVPVAACSTLQCRIPNLLTGTPLQAGHACKRCSALACKLDADAAAVGASQDLDVQCRTIRPVCRWDAEERRGRG